MIDSIKNTISIVRGNKIVKIDQSIAIYRDDIERDFDYYFDAITPHLENNFFIADYSITHDHHIIGFDMFQILCPSLADSYQTIKQYMEFGQLQENMVALDLGAYTGLASIVFALAVGPNGRVIAVEPDNLNYQCSLENINRFNNIKKFYNIELIHAAVSYESKQLYFSGEGCLGSHVINDIGMSRGNLQEIQGLTLYELTNRLNRLDFIKCDIEGMEKYIFSDDRFFDIFRPRIIIEPHLDSANLCINTLLKYKYKIDTIQQKGISTVPLLECVPL